MIRGLVGTVSPRVVLALLAAVVVLLGARRADAGSSAAHSPMIPAGFQPESFTAINDLDWWLLGGYGCRQLKCRAAVLRTTNGGRSFTALPTPTEYLDGSSGGREVPGVNQITFANHDDGWANGSGLWSTHDGGASWRRVPTPGNVDELVSAGGYVYATVDSGPAGRVRTYASLWRSPVNHDQWARLREAGTVSDGLAARGSEVLVQSSYRAKPFYALGSYLLVSHDSGRRFSRYGAPSPDSSNAFDPTSAATIWALSSGGHFEFVTRSTNSGRKFRPAGPRLEQGPPNGTPFAAASDSTAVLATGYPQTGRPSLYRTTDGGKHYTTIGPKGVNWTYLGFTDSTHGAGLAATTTPLSTGSSLYYTTDAGRSYHRVPIR